MPFRCNSLRRSTPAGRCHLSMITVLLILHVPLPLHNNEKSILCAVKRCQPTYLQVNKPRQVSTRKSEYVFSSQVQSKLCVYALEIVIFSRISMIFLGTQDVLKFPRRVKDGTAKKATKVPPGPELSLMMDPNHFLQYEL